MRTVARYRCFSAVDMPRTHCDTAIEIGSEEQGESSYSTPDVPLYADDSSSLVDQKNIDTVAHQAVEARLTTGNVRMDATLTRLPLYRIDR